MNYCIEKSLNNSIDHFINGYDVQYEFNGEGSDAIMIDSLEFFLQRFKNNGYKNGFIVSVFSDNTDYLLQNNFISYEILYSDNYKIPFRDRYFKYMNYDDIERIILRLSTIKDVFITIRLFSIVNGILTTSDFNLINFRNRIPEPKSIVVQNSIVYNDNCFVKSFETKFTIINKNVLKRKKYVFNTTVEKIFKKRFDELLSLNQQISELEIKITKQFNLKYNFNNFINNIFEKIKTHQLVLSAEVCEPILYKLYKLYKKRDMLYYLIKNQLKIPIVNKITSLRMNKIVRHENANNILIFFQNILKT